MSPSTLNAVVAGLPPAIGAGNGSTSKVSKVTMIKRQALTALQTEEKEKTLWVQTRSLKATSRREMMQLTATSVGLLSLLLPASAEARPRNATMRQKIIEKFEELRQKAGISKPDAKKEESKPQDQETKPKYESVEKNPKLKVENEGEEKKSPNGEKFVPILPNIINGKTVETTLP